MTQPSLARSLMLLAPLVIGAATVSTAAETPIIAELVAAPEAFSGRTPEIYAPVVSVTEGDDAFMLQDVSQQPLRILRSKAER